MSCCCRLPANTTIFFLFFDSFSGFHLYRKYSRRIKSVNLRVLAFTGELQTFIGSEGGRLMVGERDKGVIKRQKQRAEGLCIPFTEL